MSLMISIIFHIFGLLLCTLFLLLSFVAWIICYPFDSRRSVVHALSRILVRTYYAVPPSWRARRSIEGLEHIDQSKGYVIVMNHNNMMDIPTMYYVPLNFRWVSKREVFAAPFFGQFLYLHGDIAIERGNGAVAMAQVIEQGKEWLSRSVSVAIFPEGTRSRSGEIGRFKMGAFNLAYEADVEVLPVVMDGTRDILLPNGMCNWHNRMTVRVLPPVKLCSATHEERKAEIEQIRADMQYALKEIKERWQN